ncbi:MAG: hypothetical protein ACYC1M_14475 [Armatimonadota bacterium]
MDIQTIAEYELRALEFGARYEGWIPDQLYDWGSHLTSAMCNSPRQMEWWNGSTGH